MRRLGYDQRVMPNIGPLELAIVAIIALIIFGPKRLPELGRSIGDGLREFKSSVSGENRDDEDDEDDDELPQTIDDGVAEEEPVDAEPADDAEPAARPSS
jgi:sec-independent protein translocase protein TatA